MFRKLIALKLKWLSSWVIKRRQPKIIAITGSVGKTSTKEAVAAVLSEHFSVRKTEANYNNEIGVPLTVIGESPAGKNIFRWLYIFAKAFLQGFGFGFFPQVLVLEMGADKPRDLVYLTSFIKPDISIITGVGISHLEQFEDRQSLIYEKAALVRALSPSDVAILNADSDTAMSMAETTRGSVVTYGIEAKADFRASNIEIAKDNGMFRATVFEVDGQKYELPKAVGVPMVYAALAALVAGIKMGLNKEECLAGLRNFQPTAGRVRLIAGVNNSLLIDDTYNASPDSMVAALDVLAAVAGGRKVAILGKMAELGSETEAAHRVVGQKAAQIGLDMLAVKNNQAKITGQEAENRGLVGAKITYFESEDNFGEIFKDQVQVGDTILIKASRSDHFEKIVKALMAEPEQADELLVDH